MTAPKGFVEDNAASQQELRALVSSLSDSDLQRPVSGDWTVAACLAHLAYYDFRAAAAVDRWRSDRELSPFPLDAELDNAAIEKLLLAIPPRTATQLVLAAAEAADSRIAALTDNLLARIAAVNQSVGMYRSEHRREHIEQITSALQR